MITSNPDFKPAEATDTITCPVCGCGKFRNLYDAGDYEYKLPGTFHVAQCCNCSLIYQNPRPPFQEILRYYTEQYEPFLNVGSPIMRVLRQWFLEKPRLKRYRELVAEKKQPVRILDVGCGQGELLLHLAKEHSFNCEGVEPVEHAAKIAQKSGIKVTCATLEDASFPSNKFDLVILNHVLEHLPEPGNVVAEVHRILADGGLISGETPCSMSIERKIFGPYWSMYHLPRHLTYFSPQLLYRFLNQKGFTDIKLSLQPQPSSWQVSVRNYLNAKNMSVQLSHLFNGHSSLANMATFPVCWMAAKFGFAPIVRFTVKKPAG